MNQLYAAMERIDLRIALKSGITAGAAWTIGVAFATLFDRPDTFVSGLWCTVAAMVVLQAHIGGTYLSAVNRLIGVLAGSVIGGLCTWSLGSNPISLCISVTLTVIFCSLLNIRESIRIAGMSVAVVMISWGLHREFNPWVFAFFRALDSCLGVLIGIAMSHLLWPLHATRKLRLNTATALFMQQQLYRMSIVQIQQEQNRESKLVFLDQVLKIREILKGNSSFLEEAKIELFTQPERSNHWITLQNYLEDLLLRIIELRKVCGATRPLCDEELVLSLDKTLDSIDHVLQRLSHQLTMREPVGELLELSQNLQLMATDLARFRSKHILRIYGLDQVENFFVTFYTLEGIGRKLRQIAEKIDQLYPKTL